MSAESCFWVDGALVRGDANMDNESLQAMRDVIAAAKAKLLADARAAANPEDWAEDFAHENGNYYCTCHRCGGRFMGHKRRVTCRTCATTLGMQDTLRALADPTP